MQPSLTQHLVTHLGSERTPCGLLLLNSPWQGVRLRFWARCPVSGAQGACLGLSPQRTREKKRNQATELMSSSLRPPFFPRSAHLLPSRNPSVSLISFLEAALSPLNRFPASLLPPQSATLCSEARSVRSSPSPVSTLLTAEALPEAKEA